MRWVIYSTLLLTWSAQSTAEKAKTNSGESSATCDDNWVFFGGFCYFFSESGDSVNPMMAPHQCLLSGAEHVYPESSKELAFLQSQAKARTTYGWSINVMTRFYDKTLYHSKFHDFISDSQEARFNGSIPKFQKAYDKDNRCVALHVGVRVSNPWSSKEPEISTEPCDVKLWVVCQAKKSNVPNKVADYEKWFSHGDLMFWLSGKLANQADAKTLCNEENMELITGVTDLMQALNGTYDFTPWWTSFTLGQNGPQMEDGTAVDLTVVSWLPDSYGGTFGSILLLHSGKGRHNPHAFSENSNVPYICKKRSTVKGLFGCPNLWVRAGRSCYYLDRHTEMTWSKAKEACGALGSHLLSIDSLDEKLWLRTVATRYIPTTWTSANDIADEGKFTWHDGSAIDNNILTWQKASFDKDWEVYDYRRCMEYTVEKNEIHGRNCDYESYAACQYDLKEGETQCTDTWNELDGTCYLMDFKSDNGLTYHGNEQYCKNVLKDRMTGPLIVKTKKVVDFLSKTYDSAASYDYVWLGITAGDVLGSWRWHDGSQVDFSVFGLKDQPDNGKGEEPENCVAVNSMLQAYDETCDSPNMHICEKDLPPVGALGPLPDSASSLHVVAFAPALSTLIGVLATRWL